MLDEKDNEEVARLIVRYQHRIYTYIFSLLPDRQAAEDILQETCVTVCRKYSEFEPTTNFVAWANTIAFWKVRQAKLQYMRSKLIFSGEVQKAVSESYEKLDDELHRRHIALDQCLRKLSERDRTFVLKRYERGSGVVEAAEIVGRSIQTAYKALGRIRGKLMDCIAMKLANEGSA